eukprot:NODE_376_length_1618_cov_451.275752.p1 GENE.NODE_376_length_1618_cov_451.275752~~NODE_376_length_1618_cov_451.275752.p1  ORF type:complete len:437 (+),score=168.60 NODE_376_length_1618_cov_451.275752:209-1519(+)
MLAAASAAMPEDALAKEMAHDLEVNFNKIAPFGKEDTAMELQDHAARTQGTLVDAVENAEVAEIQRAVFRALTRLRAATTKVFVSIARLEMQATDVMLIATAAIVKGSVEEMLPFHADHQWGFDPVQIGQLFSVIAVPYILAAMSTGKVWQLIGHYQIVFGAAWLALLGVCTWSVFIVASYSHNAMQLGASLMAYGLCLGPTRTPAAPLQKFVDVPQVQVVDEVVDISITKHRHVPMVQTVQKFDDVLPVAYLNRVEEVPITKHRHVPMARTAQKFIDGPQGQGIDEAVDIPITKHRHVPMAQTVQKLADVAQVQYIDWVVDIPVTRHGHGPMVQEVQKAVPITKHRHVPIVQSVQNFVDVPQIQHQDRIVGVPVQKEVHVPVVMKVTKPIIVLAVETAEKVVDVPDINVVESPLIRAIERTAVVVELSWQGLVAR